MWLKIFHTIGLTNLTDEEVDRYYKFKKTKKAFHAAKTNEEKDDIIKEMVKELGWPGPNELHNSVTGKPWYNLQKYLDTYNDGKAYGLYRNQCIEEAMQEFWRMQAKVKNLEAQIEKLEQENERLENRQCACQMIETFYGDLENK